MAASGDMSSIARAVRHQLVEARRAFFEAPLAPTAKFERTTPSTSQAVFIGKSFGHDSERSACFFDPQRLDAPDAPLD